MKPTAFRAAYSDWRLVKTRQVVQIVFEVPLADADAAYDVVGGMPNPANETWFGIAPLKATAIATSVVAQLEKPKRDWQAVPKPQQAGIRINEATFAAYLREEHAHDWRESGEADACIKFMCGIHSKRDLATDQRAGALWFQIDSGYQAWLAKERVGS